MIFVTRKKYNKILSELNAAKASIIIANEEKQKLQKQIDLESWKTMLKNQKYEDLLTAKIKELQKENNDLKNENKNLNVEVSKYKKKIETNSNKLKSLGGEKSSLKKKIAKLEKNQEGKYLVKKIQSGKMPKMKAKLVLKNQKNIQVKKKLAEIGDKNA